MKTYFFLLSLCLLSVDLIAANVPEVGITPSASIAQLNAASNAVYAASAGFTNSLAAVLRAYTDLQSSNNVRVAAGANITVSVSEVAGVRTYTVNGSAGGGAANLANVGSGVGIVGEETGGSTPIKSFNAGQFATNLQGIAIAQGALTTNMQAKMAVIRDGTNILTELLGQVIFEGSGGTNKLTSSELGEPYLLNNLNQFYTNLAPSAAALLNYNSMQHLFAAKSNSTIASGLLLPHLTELRAAYTDSNKRLTNSSLTFAALERLASSDQHSQGGIPAGVPLTNVQARGVSLLNATANRVLITDAAKGATNSEVDAALLEELIGLTDNIQDQLNLRATLSALSGVTNALWNFARGTWTESTDPASIDTSNPRQAITLGANANFTFSVTNNGDDCRCYFMSPTVRTVEFIGPFWPQGPPTNSWSGTNMFRFVVVGATRRLVGFYDGPAAAGTVTQAYIDAATNALAGVLIARMDAATNALSGVLRTRTDAATNALAGVVAANIVTSSNALRAFTIAATNDLAVGKVSTLNALATNLTTRALTVASNLAWTVNRPVSVGNITNFVLDFAKEAPGRIHFDSLNASNAVHVVHGTNFSAGVATAIVATFDAGNTNLLLSWSDQMRTNIIGTNALINSVVIPSNKVGRVTWDNPGGTARLVLFNYPAWGP